MAEAAFTGTNGPNRSAPDIIARWFGAISDHCHEPSEQIVRLSPVLRLPGLSITWHVANARELIVAIPEGFLCGLHGLIVKRMLLLRAFALEADQIRVEDRHDGGDCRFLTART